MPPSDDNLPPPPEILPTLSKITLDRRAFLVGIAALPALPSLANGQAKNITALSPSSAPGRPYLMAQLGHSDGVTSAVFSFDDRYVLTASEDKTARLWETATGRELRRFLGHSERLNAVAFSPGGNYVLTGSDDKTVRLWEITTGKEVRRFHGHSWIVTSLTFSPDGRYVLTGSADKTARLWETATGKEVRRFQGPPSVIQAVTFSPDAKYVLTGSFDGMARLWETATGKEVRRFQGHDSLVTSVAFALSGKYILTGSWDGTARLWETATGKEVRRFQGPSNDNHSNWISSVAFSSDGRYVLTGSFDQTARLWETATGKEIRRFQNEPAEVNSVAFSSDGNYVLTASANLGRSDMSARLWETATGKEVRRFEGQSPEVLAVAFSSDSRYMLTGSFDSTARLWETATGKEIRRFLGHDGPVTSVALSADSKYALTGSVDGTSRLWEIATGKEQRRFQGHSEWVSSVVFSPNGKYVLTGSFDKTARLWETATGKEVRRFHGHSDKVSSVAFSFDGRFVLTGSEDNTARLWETATGKVMRRFRGHDNIVTSVAFAPSGKYILTGSWDGTARLWETSTGEAVRRFRGHAEWVLSVAFSSDGKHVLTGSMDRTARLWETATGNELQRFMGHSDRVNSVLFSSESKYILTGSRDGTARLWETATGKELCSLISFKDAGWAVVTPQGRFDTNNLEEIKGLHWIMPDAPMKPLPPEIFLRQYYEPRLLTRILADEKLPNVPDITSLNRVQPLVTILKVEPLPQNVHRVEVTVEVATQQGTFLQNGKEVIKTGEVFDLRLFRNGQLVGFAPQQDGKIPTSPRTGKATFSFTVALPRQAGLKEVEFTAYTFNQDRVKSATAHFTYTLAKPLPTVKGRAYIISLGVNAYQDSRWNLQFAAENARALQKTLFERLQRSGQFADVVGVALLSDYQKKDEQIIVTEQTATKAGFRAVLDILAGREVSAAVRQAIPNGEKLKKAQPEDMILFSFASHGDADGQGNFYLFPYDIGPKQDGVSADLYAHGISSAELSLWLREVDGGSLTMIVDACHSAASVENGQFKPGPMGSRGLGQLAYDKGMRILAASQADDVAIENGQIRHGLLTYALIHDGLEAGQADWKPLDKQIEVGEWLEYGEARVPKLYEEVKAGKIEMFGREIGGRSRPDVPPDKLKRRKFQQPSLFDFTKSGRAELVEKLP